MSAAVQKTEVRTRASILKERALYVLLVSAASVAVLGLLLIFVFVALRGAPIFAKYGVERILLSADWSPTSGQFGILPFIFGSFAVTFGALVLGAPLAVATAIFLSEVAPPRINAVVRPAVELLAGIPSVVYGFFGVIIIVPRIRALLGGDGGGFGLVSAAIVLAIMIVPTIAAISEDAISAVPRSFREASAAMGATHWQTISGVVLPAARRGIIDAIVLGMGRAVGETIAVYMVLGNAAVIPRFISDPAATLTSIIVLDMPYASGDHQRALFGIGIVLLLVSMSFVAAIRLLSMKRRGRR
ncbi:MAG: phosphate ABC transporter permease subunit PstC [Actinobacteria bacterium]|nr:MAG: phosphate ABC transporter permease subunit PstC [Actinomycetota bacterium]